MPAAALAWDGALRDPNQKTSQPVVSSRRMVSVRRIVDVSLTSSAMAELSSMTKVRSVQGVEQLGQLYAFTVDVIAVDRALDVPALLETPLCLELATAGEEGARRIHGIAKQITDYLVTETTTLAYRIELVPRAWRLSLTRRTEIFMDMTVPDVITEKLQRLEMKQGTDFELRLRDAYATREYIVQYDESDLAFVQRLAEHVGLTLWFEQHDEQERLVVSDHNEAFGPVAGGGTARFYPRGEARGIYDFRTTTRTLPSRYVVKDYNYRTPQVPLLAESDVQEGSRGLTYEYGGHFKTPDEAQHLARVRAEETTSRRVRVEGQADDQRFMPGAVVKVEGHPLGEPELLLTRVEHDYRSAILHGGSGDEHGYRLRFDALLSGYAFRPARVTPKPRIHGCITAAIESSAESPYAELDDQGRYRVRFSFDVDDRDRASASRLVRMAQPHTGPGYGFHFPLRHGVEVLITFIDGDPDRPIISNAVPNPQTPSVVGSQNGVRNIIRTGAGNEINIDDTEGAERIKLSTPHGSTFQLGAPNTPSAGASLATDQAWNAVAQNGATTASTAVSVFSDIASTLASADIIGYAGTANILAALSSKGAGIIKKTADVVKGVVDHGEKTEALEVAKAKEAASSARNKAETAKVLGYSENALKDFEHKALTAEAQARALEAAKAKNDVSRGQVKSTTERVAAGLGGAANLADAWTKASGLAGKSAGAMAAASAGTAAAVGSALASVGRIGGAVPAPGSPKNIQGAASSAVLIGNANAVVSSFGTSACVGSSSAILAGGAKVLVKSPAQAEMAGMARALITSGALVDLKSGAVLKCASGSVTAMRAGASMGLTAGARMSLKAGAAFQCKAGGTAKIQSASNMTLKSGGKIDVSSPSDLRLTGGSRGLLKGAGSLVSVKDVITVKAAGACNIDAAGDVTIKGANIALNTGPVTVKNKTTIKAKLDVKAPLKVNGKCMLG